jgi:hypothetical protein
MERMVLFVMSDLDISVWKSLLQAHTFGGLICHLESGEATFWSMTIIWLQRKMHHTSLD